MRKIFGIGETVFDIIFKNGQPQAAKPGGAMLNSIVSLGRAALPVHFISEYADDDVGSLIDTFLHSNGVDTSSVHHYKDGKTKLALAFLNERNDASYTFYEKYSEKRLEIVLPEIVRNDIFLCGSIYAITDEIRDKFRSLVGTAFKNGAIVIYDPNFRSAHRHELGRLKPLIVENMSMASLVRGSDEDFSNIFGAATPDEAWNAIRNYCKCLVYTANAEGVYVRTEKFSGRFPVKKLTPVSTIGAGDNFNAGMMAAIHINGITVDELASMGEESWKKVVTMGVDFASEVCMSYDNYISEEFAAKVKSSGT
jgi:fructokinase